MDLAAEGINIHQDLNLQISFFRISYDEESNQEFYLDLLNLNSKYTPFFLIILGNEPTINSLKDINVIKILSKSDLRRLLEIAEETNFNFTDEK